MSNRLAICLFVWCCAGCQLSSNQEILRPDQIPPLEHLNVSTYSRALTAMKKGKSDRALQLFERVLHANPHHGRAYNNAGLIYYEQRKLQLAAAHFLRTSELLPKNPTPLNNLGMTLEAGGRVDEALAYYEDAHSLAPGVPLYLGNLLRLRIKLGMVDDLTIQQLEELAFIEDRPEWIQWVDRQLALHLNPSLDRGPKPTDFNAVRKSQSAQSAKDEFEFQDAAPILELNPANGIRDESLESLPVPAPLPY